MQSHKISRCQELLAKQNTEQRIKNVKAFSVCSVYTITNSAIVIENISESIAINIWPIHYKYVYIYRSHLNAKTQLTEIPNRHLDMYEPALQSTFALLTRAHTANHATSILNHASKQTTNNNAETIKAQMKMQKITEQMFNK